MGYPEVIIADEPISYYRLNESSGIIAEDEMDNLDGAFDPTLILQEPGLRPSDPTAKSVYFTNAANEGWGNFLTLGNVFGRTVGDYSYKTPITVEMWIKPDQISVIGLFDSSPYDGWCLRQYPANNFEWHDNDPRVAITLEPGTTYHIVFAFYMDTVRKVKGWLNGTPTWNGTGASASGVADFNWVIGRINAGSAGQYKGWMQDVALYDKVLTDGQVLAHYNAGSTVSESHSGVATISGSGAIAVVGSKGGVGGVVLSGGGTLTVYGYQFAVNAIILLDLALQMTSVIADSMTAPGIEDSTLTTPSVSGESVRGTEMLQEVWRA